MQGLVGDLTVTSYKKMLAKVRELQADGYTVRTRGGYGLYRIIFWK